MADGYILIDANNMAHKALYACNGRQTSSGMDTSVIYGTMNQLAKVRSDFATYIPMIVWDGGYKARTAISEKGVKAGLIPDVYKGNRDKSDPLKKSLYDQVPHLRKILSATNIPQFVKDGFEADDVIASYTKMLKNRGHQVVCYTVDQDYYQLIDKDVFCVARLNGEEQIVSLDDYREMFQGISPSQWVDVGALAGDTGDNIFGSPGCGIKTAVALVAEHGTYEDVIRECCRQFAALRAEYPDLTEESEIQELRNMRADKKINPFRDCYPGMRFTGVALASERGKIKKQKMTPLCIAMFQDRIRLAYNLKKMYDDLAVPEFKLFDRWSRDTFLSLCSRYELNEIAYSVELFSCRNLK